VARDCGGDFSNEPFTMTPESILAGGSRTPGNDPVTGGAPDALAFA
jgi:hypothetical protein